MRGWDQLDVVLFSGDAYVDHPSFGAAVIGRVLEAAGYKVALVPQPNWRDDLRDFRKLGKPRLFFGISPGAMDSMVNHYTAAKRRRSDDAYTPDGRAGQRPDMPSIVYSKILRELYPDVPIILGGIEASLRRLSYYDYWEDRLRPSLLTECEADVICYGMGEKTMIEIARRIEQGLPYYDVPQVVSRQPRIEVQEGDIVLHPFEECLKNKRAQAENFRHIEEESNQWHSHRLWQQTVDVAILVTPMYPPLTTEEVDRSFDLPYTRMPHPRYNGKRIPAYEMIRHSICMHRGCFGGCSFCTISAHQGKFIASRSKESILREARQVIAMPDFKGYISDLGGPSANMYRMRGKDLSICEKCKKPSCLAPGVCPNLDADHRPLLEIYKAVDALPGVKKSFIGSGVRYDLILNEGKDGEYREINRKYAEELICHHVSGRLKVAPEHTNPEVLKIMRKPSFELFHRFKAWFDDINRKYGLRQQIIPYFISSHPGSTEEAMAELAAETKSMDFQLEQVQDFTPTPMTVSTEIYFTGLHPYTLKPCYCAHNPAEKQRQRAYFFWYQKENIPTLRTSLQKMGRRDLIERLFRFPGKPKKP
ncbi:MAG: YgiQ family radical SAM protein [Bacteroidales bacterium]|nr:YgiQ family radical SAM protein [Bacteroidales bacterium]